MRAEGHWRKYVVFCAANGVLYLLVTIWARLAGFTDACLFLCDEWRCSRAGARRVRHAAEAGERAVGFSRSR